MAHSPPSPPLAAAPLQPPRPELPSVPFGPAVCVVGFHHARGPEIEGWFGAAAHTDPAIDNNWSTSLPFMALSDGIHTALEDFSFFTLHARPPYAPASLFGMSCTRQIDAKELLVRGDGVTRSTVQKSVVVVCASAGALGAWREKLGVVTRAWFGQRDFSDTEILKAFQESLVASMRESEEERDQYLGMSLREFIHEFKHLTLVLFKCALLQPKMLFFGSKCERLCMMQFALVSLIPGLLKNLEDCADPELDSYEKSLAAPTSLRTSDRNSLLAYMGLPLQIFGKGSLFGPYTPLQQLDTLADYGTKSYIVGSTNSLLLQQKDRYSDILINLDETTVTISSASLRSALALSAADRRWIDALYGTIHSTWDPDNPSRPRTHGYLGSEEFIRLQFEEYLLALLSAVKYHQYLYSVPYHKRELSAFSDIEGDPSIDFGENWVEAWKQTNNYKLWNKFTDSSLFAISEPRHPTAGGLSIEDINRRFNQQIADLHLDERLATSKETINKHLVTGQKKVSTAFNNLWSDIEALRAAQQAKRQQQQQQQKRDSNASASPDQSLSDLPSPSQFDVTSPDKTPVATPSSATFFDASSIRARAPDLSAAQAAVGAAGSKAGAYLSSWGTWATERRKGWAAGSKNNSSNSSPSATRSLDNTSIQSAPPHIQAFGEQAASRHHPANPNSLSPLPGRETPGNSPFIIGSSEDTTPALTPNPMTPNPAAPDSPLMTSASTTTATTTATDVTARKDKANTKEPTNMDGGNGSPTRRPRDGAVAAKRTSTGATSPRKSPRKTLSWKSGRSREEVIGSDGIGRLDA